MDDLDATTSAEATAYLEGEIDDGHANLVIDFGGVTYLSSAGLRVILGAMRRPLRHDPLVKRHRRCAKSSSMLNTGKRYGA